MGIMREVLLEIINKGLFFELGIIIVLYLIFWRVSFLVSSFILGVRPKFIRMVPASLIMTLFNICIGIFIPDYLDIIRAVIMAALVILLLRFTMRTTYYKAYWVSLIICCYGFVGDTVVCSWCYLGGKNAAVFFLESVWGAVAVILIKIIFVTAALFIVPKLRISLIPLRRKKLNKGDKLSLFFQGNIYLGFYLSIPTFYYFLHTVPHIGFKDIFLPWAVAYIAVVNQYKIADDAKKIYDLGLNNLGLEICVIIRMNPDLNWEEYFPVLLEGYGVEREEAAAAIQSVIDKNKEEIKQISS